MANIVTYKFTIFESDNAHHVLFKIEYVMRWPHKAGAIARSDDCLEQALDHALTRIQPEAEE